MNVDEFRRVLCADDDLDPQIPVERIRRRARQIRARRGAGVTVALAVVVAVVATLAVTLPGRSAGQQAGTPSDAATNCPSSTAAPMVPQVDLAPIDTGVVVPAGDGTQYHVILGLTGPTEDPFLTVGYRDPTGGLLDAGTQIEIGPHPGGDFSGKHTADPTHRFLSVQVPLGPHSVLDMGVYSRSAARISVASADQPSDAHLQTLPATGWTLFWVRRDAAPLPEGAKSTQTPYQGPEQVTLTAYAADGTVEHTVNGASEEEGRFIALPVQSLAAAGPGGSATMSACPQPDPTGS
jgi:hypothetical protein